MDGHHYVYYHTYLVLWYHLPEMENTCAYPLYMWWYSGPRGPVLLVWYHLQHPDERVVVTPHSTKTMHPHVMCYDTIHGLLLVWYTYSISYYAYTAAPLHTQVVGSLMVVGSPYVMDPSLHYLSTCHM